jgi:hypothetical protein
VVVGSVGVSIVGVSLLEPLVSVPAAATPAKTRIALMMIAAFVNIVHSFRVGRSSCASSVSEGVSSAGYAKARLW